MLEGSGLTIFIIVIFSLIVSITLHEAMHAFTSHWLGDDTAHREGRISLNPLRHIDPFATIILPIITLLWFHMPLLAAKPVPFNPNRVKYEEFGAALVGLAGPFTNLLLALAAAGLARIFGGFGGQGFVDILGLFSQVNIALFIFNMIPIPPLDGSRLLYAVAPESLQEVMAQLEQWGVFLVFGIVVLFPGFSNFLIYLNKSLFNLIF